MMVEEVLKHGGSPERERDVALLERMARHFDGLPTGGEDKIYWFHVRCAETCRRIARDLAQR